jgi:hypothetical protein
MRTSGALNSMMKKSIDQKPYLGMANLPSTQGARG